MFASQAAAGTMWQGMWVFAPHLVAKAALAGKFTCAEADATAHLPRMDRLGLLRALWQISILRPPQAIAQAKREFRQENRLWAKVGPFISHPDEVMVARGAS